MPYAIKIRFLTENNFISNDIKFATHAPFKGASHAEIELPDGTFLGSRARGGVAIRPANYCKPTWERRYAVPCTEQQYKDCMDFLHKQIGKPYDFRDIVGILLDANWHNADAWICSELVLAALLYAGIEFLNVLAPFTYRIDPDKLHLSPKLIGCLYFSA